MSNAKIYSLKRQETRHRTHIDSMNRQETRHRTQTDSLNRQDTMNSTQTDSLNRQDTMNSTQTDSLNRQDTMNSTQTDSMNRQNTINSTTIYNYGFLMRWTSIIISLWRVRFQGYPLSRQYYFYQTLILYMQQRYWFQDRYLSFAVVLVR
jgi:uncharacterized Rmd1/YagE family protein